MSDKVSPWFDITSYESRRVVQSMAEENLVNKKLEII